MKVRTARFNGNQYKIDVDIPYEGECDCHFAPEKLPFIKVSVDINTKAGIIALLHECGHAENWQIPEVVIDRYAVDVGTLLYRLMKSGQLKIKARG